jgi:hypothetical protein
MLFTSYVGLTPLLTIFYLLLFTSYVIHLGLIVPKGTGINVAGRKASWAKGQALMYGACFSTDCLKRAGVLPMAFLSGVHLSYRFTL